MLNPSRCLMKKWLSKQNIFEFYLSKFSSDKILIFVTGPELPRSNSLFVPLDLPALCRSKLRQCNKGSNDYNEDNGVFLLVNQM